LITHDWCHAEHLVRQLDNRWLLSETNKIEAALHLSSFACTLVLTEVYDKVDLPA
jgi:hypothetical protein